ncbi:hypothetical protein BAE44_0008655, partial [Dichanthelium oligosanthes]
LAASRETNRDDHPIAPSAPLHEALRRRRPETMSPVEEQEETLRQAGEGTFSSGPTIPTSAAATCAGASWGCATRSQTPQGSGYARLLPPALPSCHLCRRYASQQAFWSSGPPSLDDRSICTQRAYICSSGLQSSRAAGAGAISPLECFIFQS